MWSFSPSTASFPGLSKRVSFLRIPRIVFFIGKHFGTGVILSTAFTHLLQDAFEALRDPIVLAKWKIGKHTGLIVLGSLLSIFLIEYTSTAYVDRLQSYSSPTVTRGSTPCTRWPSPYDEETSGLPQTPVKLINNVQNHDRERQPLLNARSDSQCYDNDHDDEHNLWAAPNKMRHEQIWRFHHTRSNTNAHTRFSLGTYTGQNALHLDEVTQDAPTIIEGHHRHEPRTAHSIHHERGPRLSYFYNPGENGQGMTLVDGGTHDHDVEHLHHHHDGNAGHELRIGKKRQVVGILVLQLGIMIHSLVIGLTLAIKTGSDFASLLVAVIFHQFFEGLSLGIRIASLPSSSSSTSEALGNTEPGVHDQILKPTLACSFAVTTPVGIGLGMIVFGVGGSSAHMRLVQGLMSAISAGMLIYAACVEMLAADFVMDPTLWRSGWRRQCVALGSLLMGAIGMGVVP
ncbi:Zinc/iron permease [Pisolithus croceorrhizus]|nr:Zinc/iron permease [Pisolithus croceorrhizus]